MVDRAVTLNNGVTMPIIGHGSWAWPTEEEQSQVKGWILTALKAGYRHIDTGLIYLTEKAIGEAIRESGVSRQEIFITTKLPWNHHGRVKESLHESLNNLGMDYVDQYLLHWPQAVLYEDGNWTPKNPDGTIKTTSSVSFHDSWKELEELLKAGKVRSIGVSNFSIKTLEDLFTTATVVPAVNQVELHPYLVQEELRKYCASKGIVIVAYTPSGGDPVRNDPLIHELAAKYSVTPTQIILAWSISQGVVIIPKSTKEDRQVENMTLPTLEPHDVNKITSLDRNDRISNKADELGQVFGWTYEQLGW